ncbi:MAG: hypothetical protein J2P47_05690 [Acetobacteraceae bacterium]|nr:hypothetical protein [Acetobacteraceae bacterium]
MTKAIIAVIMSSLELIEQWTGFQAPGITPEWIETTLMILTPILIYFVPDDWLHKRS